MRIGIAGVGGRMGRMLVPLAAQAGTLAGGIDRSGEVPAGVRQFTDLTALAGACDVVIDFTCAESAGDHARILAQAGTAWVLGTTGLDAAGQRAVRTTAGAIGIVQAANFSPGMTLLLALAERLGQALPAADYDAEILEMHHRQKLDAPSGTALALGAAVAAGRRTAPVPARADRAGARVGGEIGYACLRGGQIVGEHALSFTAAGEQITLSHRAFDRGVFAQGAVRAALWLEGRPAGLYGMRDVLGV